ncbi:baculoviral IAP repeat-containing protein 3 [Sitodiplosis mosellana]|uniref:baculoviral IAP repeat-containing protein 3 n=1 Tax=Sitodiplosis mosellana TaxID=263140 RepID=UPI002443DC97|nr:baculoviral IAP repeat-containing protein 3 [Sitodiplosis mosellana]
MLATICGWIETIVSVFVKILAAGYVLGRLIAHILSFISDVVVELVKIVAAFAVTFYEDAKIFVHDMDYQYGHILKMLNTGINNSVDDASRVALTMSSSITWFSEQTKSETQRMFMGFLNLFSSSAMGIRNWIVLVGNSVWMLLMCIPNLTILIVQNVIKFTLFIWKSIVDTIKLSTNVASDSISITVTFFTSVPLQSVCGLITIHFIIRYRQHVLEGLKFVYRAIVKAVQYFVRNIITGMLAVAEFLTVLISPLRSFVPNVWRLSSIQDDYANPSTSPTKVDAFNFCVICQDKVKSIVLLPCRHLCLCQECFRQLRRYRRECPMCREPYEHSIQVYA